MAAYEKAHIDEIASKPVAVLDPRSPPLRDRDLRHQPVARARRRDAHPRARPRRGRRAGALLHRRRPRDVHDRGRGGRRARRDVPVDRRLRDPGGDSARPGDARALGRRRAAGNGLQARRLGLALPRRRQVARVRSDRSGRARWPSGSSKPVRSCNPRLGRFDSGAAPLRPPRRWEGRAPKRWPSSELRCK